MRGVPAAVVVAAGIGVTAAQACEVPDLRQPGETRASADERLHRESQARLFAESDVVFIDELSSIARQDGIYIEVTPLGPLKGEVRSARIGYPFDQSMLGCGLLSWPTMESPGVYFATRTSNGELRVSGMLTYDAIRDQALLEQVNERMGLESVSLASGDRMSSSPAQSLLPWAWLAGAAGLSFLTGLGIGRMGRKASNRQRLRS